MNILFQHEKNNRSDHFCKVDRKITLAVKLFFFCVKMFIKCFTKVVGSVGHFMLKKVLYLFFKSINTLTRNSSVKVEEKA